MIRVLPILLMLAGCDALPRDPDGTLDRVRAGRVLRVGIPDGFVDSGGKATALIAAIAKTSGATPRRFGGMTEPLLVALERDRLDLVVAPFSETTPWATKVALGPPLAIRGKGKDRVELRAAMRGGENQWIMLVERASHDVAPEAADQ